MGAFEDYFSQEDVKRTKKKKRPDRLNDEAEDIKNLSVSIRRAAHNDLVADPKHGRKMVEELLSMEDRLAFATVSAMFFDVAQLSGVEPGDVEHDKTQAALVLIFSYIREYEKRKGAEE